RPADRQGWRRIQYRQGRGWRCHHVAVAVIDSHGDIESCRPVVDVETLKLPPGQSRADPGNVAVNAVAVDVPGVSELVAVRVGGSAGVEGERVALVDGIGAAGVGGGRLIAGRDGAVAQREDVPAEHVAVDTIMNQPGSEVAIQKRSDRS